METFDSLRPDQQITVTIWGPDDTRLFQSTDNGFHSIEEAIRTALDNAALQINPELCVFEVTDQATLVSHRYRFNADGNLVLIV